MFSFIMFINCSFVLRNYKQSVGCISNNIIFWMFTKLENANDANATITLSRKE